MAGAGPSATLLVDGVLGPGAPRDTTLPTLSAPGLDLLLTRGRTLAAPAPSQEAALFELFGLSPSPEAWGGDLPVAALCLAADTGRRPQGWWMRLDPVRLRPATDDLVLVEPQALSLSRAEADALRESVLAHFGAQQWQLLAPVPERWYLQPPAVPSLVTTPLPGVIARPVSGALPRGDDGARWRGLLNEMQMLLFDHPVNVAREQQGAPPVNSLWPWGGGVCPDVTGGTWEGVAGDDLLLAGLALAGGTDLRALPEDANAWLDGVAGRGGTHLLVLDGLRNAASYRDGEAWWAGAQGVDHAWVHPLVQAVTGGRLSRLELIDPRSGGHYALDRRSSRRWWRRPRPFLQAHSRHVETSSDL